MTNTHQDDVAALIERLHQAALSADSGYAIDAELVQDAAAALERLAAENARLNSALDMVAEERDAYSKGQSYWVASAMDEKNRAERAEAERDRLRRDAEAAYKLIAAAQWAQDGYCPWCAGWEVERGRGCKPKVHHADCPAKFAIAASGTGEGKHD